MNMYKKLQKQFNEGNWVFTCDTNPVTIKEGLFYGINMRRKVNGKTQQLSMYLPIEEITRLEGEY